MVMMHTTLMQKTWTKVMFLMKLLGEDVEFLDELEIQTILTPWN